MRRKEAKRGNTGPGKPPQGHSLASVFRSIINNNKYEDEEEVVIITSILLLLLAKMRVHYYFFFYFFGRGEQHGMVVRIGVLAMLH